MKTEMCLRRPGSNTLMKLILVPVLAVLFGTGGCSVYEEAVRGAIDDAVSEAVDRELGSRMAGYTDVMMYQLAYTQTFFLGGYGFDPDAFEEGQGATWRVESIDQEETSSFTAERALLKRKDDGTMWWYLKFHAEEMEPVEYEILLGPDLQAREMYIRDPEREDIRYHQFAYDEQEIAEAEEGDASIAEVGYHTNYYFTEEWSEFRESTETITIGTISYDTDLLYFNPADHEEYEDELEEDENYEFRWWVTKDVPGELVKFEYKALGQGGTLRGELVEIRDDYTIRFADL